MSTESAAYWLDAIALSGIVIWMIGVWFVVQTRSVCAAPIEGEFEVAASPARIMEHMVAALSRSHRGVLLGNSTIDQATVNEVRWHRDLVRQSGWVRISGSVDGSHVSYGVALGSGVIKAALVLVVLGALTIAGLYTLLASYVVLSESPFVRGQVIQMVHCVHLLWPPFLLIGIARQRRRSTRIEIERILKNAPFRDSL